MAVDKFEYIKCSVLCITCLLIPIAGFTAEWPESSSKIPNVYILDLGVSGTDAHPSAYIRDPEHEIIKHCAIENNIYVLGMPGKAQCLLEPGPDISKISVLFRTDNKVQGLVTVSTRKFPSQRFRLESLSEQDKQRNEILLSARRAQLHKEEDIELKESIAKGWTTQEAHTMWMSQLINSMELESKRFPGAKINTTNATYVIAEVGIRTNAIGWDFRFAVFDTTNESPEFLGEFEGCVNDFADIDGDGVPEVRTSLCDNTEGSIESYWSLTELRRVVSWEGS